MLYVGPICDQCANTVPAEYTFIDKSEPAHSTIMRDIWANSEDEDPFMDSDYPDDDQERADERAADAYYATTVDEEG